MNVSLVPRIAACTALAALVLGCAHTVAVDPNTARHSIEETLDNWHRAAAEADASGYIGGMDENGVFLGTDGTERWTTDEFAEFVEPYFSKGEGWTYVPSGRHIRLSTDGRTAWFDEHLGSDGYGDLRGTGVLVLVDQQWRIAQYNMTFVLPNGVTRRVVTMLRGSALGNTVPPALSAGTYFGTTTYRSVCEGCPTPGFAVITGVYDTEAACEKPLKRLSTVPMQAGYPLIVHTDELAPSLDELQGIAIVLGLFEKREGAVEWLGAMGPLVGTTRIIELLDREAAYDRAYASVEAGEADELVQTRLVRIQAGAPTPAYRREDVDEYEQEHGIGPIPDGAIEPLCTIEEGTFFAIKNRTFNHRYYAHAPVVCPNGEAALVSWQSTLVDTAVVSDKQGRAVLHQVVGAECDSPLVESWHYDENGRYRMPRAANGR